MRTLNVLRAALLLMGCIVLASAVHAMHYYQVKRNASVFKDAADKAEEKKDYPAAMRNLRWYLDLVQGSPEEANTLERLGFIITDTAGANAKAAAGAIPIFEQLLRMDPTRSDARRRLAKTLLGVGRYTDAKSHLEPLLVESPKDASLYELLGRCETRLGKDDKAVAAFEEAIKLAPDQLEAYAPLAWILRNHLDRPHDADKWMERVEEKNPKSCKACVLHGNYLLAVGNTKDAAKVVEKALKLAPDDRDALWLAARSELAARHFSEAKKYAARGVQLYKNDWEMHLMLAQVELHSGDLEKALSILCAGVEATNRDPRLICSLATLYLEARKVPETREMLAALRAARIRPARFLNLPPDVFFRYMDARILFIQDDWLKARAPLEDVRPEMTDNPGLQKQVDFCLGRCYRHAGATDKELAAYRRALEIDPTYAPAHAGAAEVYLGQGKIDQAIGEYKQVVKSEHAADETWIELARMLVMKNLRRPAEQRDWDEVDQALKRAAEHNPSSPQVPLLFAEVLVARDQLPEAERLLEQLRDRHPEQMEYWTVLANLAERQGEWDKAEKLLNDAKHRARRQGGLADRSRPASRSALRSGCGEAGERTGGEDGEVLSRRAAATLGRPDRLESASSRRRPGPPSVRSHRERGSGQPVQPLPPLRVGASSPGQRQTGRHPCGHREDHRERPDVAVRPGGPHQSDGERKRQGGGREGPQRCPAVPGPSPRRAADLVSLGAARGGHLRPASQARPCPGTLRRGHSARGAQPGGHPSRRRNFEQAAEIRRGRQAPADAGRAADGAESGIVEDERRRSAAAEGLRARVGDAEQGEVDGGRFEELAGSALVGGSAGDFRPARARDGRGGEADASFAEAEKAFRRALTLNDKAVESWISFVQFFASSDQLAKAKEVVGEAAGKIPAKEAPAALAQCYEVLRDAEQVQKKTDEATEDGARAQQKYEAAMAAAPDDPQIIRRVADFYLRSRQLASAEPLLKQLLAGKGNPPADDVVWARRQLAMTWASYGGYANLQRASKLIEENLATGEPTPQDLRLQASFLAIDPSPTRRLQAIDAMETLLQREELTSPDDRFQLAQLYLALGNMAKFREHMRALLAKSGTEKAKMGKYALHYIEAELAHNEIDEAELWLSKLEKEFPEQFVLVGFRADILMRHGHTDSALILLDKFVGNTNLPTPTLRLRQRQTAALLEQFANRLHAMKKPADSARCLQKAEILLRAEAEETPGREMALASFLARCGNVQEALAILGKKWANCDAVSVGQAMQAAIRSTGGKFTGQRAAEAEKILLAAAKKFDDNVTILLVLADFYTAQSRFADAEQCYRNILAKQPNHGAALNNLALLLAVEKTHLDEAETLINHAIEWSGAMASMLDTRAQVYLCSDKPDKALPDIIEAVGDERTPVRLFHLAWTYSMLGRKVDASETLREAEKAGLSESSLESYERPVYLKLRDE